MKKIASGLVFCTAVLLLACSQQKKNGFTISGNIKGWDGPFVYLSWQQGDSSIKDSVPVKDGKFTFTGEVSEPAMAVLFAMNGENDKQFYLENSDIHIEGTYEALPQASITGSATQAALDSLLAETDAISARMETLNEQPESSPESKDTTMQGALDEKIQALENEIRTKQLEFISAHPKSVASLDLFHEIVMDLPYPKLSALFSGLDAGLQNSPNGQRLGKLLETIKLTDVGQKAMDFTQNDLQGHAVHFEDFRKGKYVLIDFWASWCGPCRAENPNVVAAYNQFKNKNFTILGISLDDNQDRWKDAVTKDGLPWTHVSDLKGWKNEVAVKYGISAVPSNFLIDTAGNIIARNLHGAALQRKLGEIFH